MTTCLVTALLNNCASVRKWSVEDLIHRFTRIKRAEHTTVAALRAHSPARADDRRGCARRTGGTGYESAVIGRSACGECSMSRRLAPRGCQRQGAATRLAL